MDFTVFLLLARRAGDMVTKLRTKAHARARRRLGRLSSSFGERDTDLPKPRVIVEDLDLVVLKTVRHFLNPTVVLFTLGVLKAQLNISILLHTIEGFHGFWVASVPAAGRKMNIRSLVFSHRDNIDTLNETPAKAHENALDTAVVDVVENTWDANADPLLGVAVDDEGLLRRSIPGAFRRVGESGHYDLRVRV